MREDAVGWEGDASQLLVSIDAGTEADPREVEQLSRRLRAELLRLDLQSVVPAGGRLVPEGAKAGDATSWSTLLLTLAASGGVLTTTIGVLRDWLLRQPTPLVVEVTIGDDSIRLEGGATEERRRLVEAFISRHERPSG